MITLMHPAAERGGAWDGEWANIQTDDDAGCRRS